jgi:hypothetical protein
MYSSNVLSDSLSKLRIDFYFSQEMRCHISQRFKWPREEPVDSSIRNQTGEVSAPNTQGITRRRHSKANMKVFSRSLDKVSPSEFFGFRKLVLLDLLVHHLTETLFFFFGE